MTFDLEAYEKHLIPIRKDLLYRLRQEDWKIVDVTSEKNDWCTDDIWKITSQRQNYGITIDLWFFKYDGLYDGMNNVVAWPEDFDIQPSPYGGGDVRLDFGRRRYEKELEVFIESLHQFRLTGKLESSDKN